MHPRHFILATATLLGSLQAVHAQNVTVYASAPGAQSAADTGYTAAAGYNVQFEGFTGINATTAGTSFPTPFTSSAITQTTATFTSAGTVNVYAAGTMGESQYGGYNQGNFVAVNTGVGNSLTVSFSSGVAYFGFLFPAADAGAKIQLFGNNNSLIGTFNTSDLTTLLQSHTTLTSVDGQHTYQSSAYYGQPTTGFDNGEPYAFLSFIGSGGTTISRAVLTESLANSKFEADNFTVIAGNPAALGVQVLVSTVPEPSSWALACLGVVGLGLVTCRRRRAFAR